MMLREWWPLLVNEIQTAPQTVVQTCIMDLIHREIAVLLM